MVSDNLHMYLQNSIERILQDPAIKRKEHLLLRKECELALGMKNKMLA